ncbi:outer membrane protein [Legionella sp. CNM-4043-24]|uniref:outer membrane protein n=1 Tax=Legionella sp. CNM-4043-24 TaxID=3421646 RepID=UPI00403B21F1
MRIALFSAALIASGASFAATPVQGWYGSVFGGYSYIPENVDITRYGLARNNAAYNSGYHAGARIGYQSNPLRYEGEYTYITANLKKFTIDNIPQLGVNGSTTANLAMANIYYDFPDMVPAIQPFLGVGLGYGWVQGVLNSDGPIFSTRYTGESSVFAYQATGGFTYNFAENFAVNIAYRYVGTDRVSELGKFFQAHLGSVGVIYRFNQSSYK